MTTFVDWTLCANNITFDYDDGYIEPSLGRKETRRRSPNWFISFRFPTATDEKRRLLDHLRYQSPTGTFNISDPSRPYPKYWEKLVRQTKIDPANVIPAVSVSAMDANTRTITVTGQDEDLITCGDPLAFTHDGYRYYFRAGEDLRLDGSAQQIGVVYEPLRTLMLPNIAADRINPTMRFHVRLNGLSGRTDIGILTELGELQGVEWTRRVV